MDERVAGGRRGSFLAAGACPSGALGSPAGARVSGEPVDGRTLLNTCLAGLAAGAGLAGRRSVFQARGSGGPVAGSQRVFRPRGSL